MKKLIISIILVWSSFFATGVCLAKEFISKEGTFEINVSDGWHIDQDEKGFGKVWISLPGEDDNLKVHLISIQPLVRLDPSRGVKIGIEIPPGIKEEDFLDYNLQKLVEFLKSGGDMSTIISQQKILLDGLPAFRVDGILDFRSRGGILAYTSYIECITKEYIYDIGLNSSDKEGMIELDKMLNTIKIKR